MPSVADIGCEIALELARIERAALAKVAAGMVAKQEGLAFAPADIAADFARAVSIVRRAEHDLGDLSDGQRRDLLADNTEWHADHIRAIVEAMTW